jgi:hypothetical protein
MTASALCRVAAIYGLMASAAWAAKSPPQNFDAFLVEGYSQMAEAGQRSHDPRQPFFHQRALLAAQDKGLLPVDPDKQFLDSWTLREADFARRQLISRLDAGARQEQPLLAAIAQVNFDCWVAPAPRKPGTPDGDECRRRFYFAFAGLVPGARDLPGQSAPAVDSASQRTIAASGRQTGSRPLIVAPLAAASSSPGSESAPHSVQASLASIALGPSHPIECDQKGQNCVAIAFTGPSADVLIRDLRDGGADYDGADKAGTDSPGAGSGESPAASASSGDTASSGSAASANSDTASTSPGNGKGKGKGHGNGHGKGPG